MENNILANYGIVYVLTNSAMPGLVKIGMTTRNEVELRMKELFGTGVPVPFECAYACLVDVEDCAKVEKALHIAFAPNRLNPTREFFTIEPDQAIAILKLLDKRDITSEIVAEINDDITIEDRVADERLKKSRRPPLNFIEMGIPNGSRLQYGGENNQAEVEICGEKKVRCNGREMSLTAATREILQLDYNIQPTPYWFYNGKKLQDIYDETYTIED